MSTKGRTWCEALAVALVVAVALAIAGCGEGAAGETGDGGPTAAATERAEPDTGTDAEPEPEPEPISDEEERWLRMLTRYSKRFEREYFRGGAVTHSSMGRAARLLRDCRGTLRRAGDPGRLEPAAKRARRACERLDRAARLLDRAISVSDPDGSVVVGTPEERIFSRSTARAGNIASNGHYGLQRAQELGEQIARNLRG